jgi:hypothetical protein
VFIPLSFGEGRVWLYSNPPSFGFAQDFLFTREL